MTSNQTPRWHYTPGYWAALIVDDGAIKPTSKFIYKGERPTVWFSSNPTWEGTATKLRNCAGMIATHEAGAGLYRFGVAPETAPINWLQFAEIVGLSEDQQRSLRRKGKALNGNHREWFVTFEQVTSDQWTSIERWDRESGLWKPADLTKLPSVEVARSHKSRVAALPS